MANSSIAHTTPTRPQTRPTAPHAPDPAAVLSYCASGRSNAEAAQHFGINERTVRKLKARARATMPITRAVLPQDAPKTPVPTFPEASTDETAGEHTLWRDPWSGDLINPPPGAIRRVWEAERRAAQARHLAGLITCSNPDLDQDADYVKPDEPGPAHTETEDPAQARPSALADSASQSVEIGRPDPAPVQAATDEPARPIPTYHNMPSTADVQTLAPQLTPHVGASPPIVVTRVVRVPVEARPGGVVAWLNDRPGLRNQLLAMVVFLVLVVMTWIG